MLQLDFGLPVNLTQLIEGRLDDLDAPPDPLLPKVETDFPGDFLIEGENVTPPLIPAKPAGECPKIQPAGRAHPDHDSH